MTMPHTPVRSIDLPRRRVFGSVMALAVMVPLLAVSIAAASAGAEHTTAGVDGVTAALFMWAAVTAAATIASTGIEAMFKRIRAINDPGKP